MGGGRSRVLEVVVVAGRGWSPLHARIIGEQIRVLSMSRESIVARYIVSLGKPGAKRLARMIRAQAEKQGLNIIIDEVNRDRGVSHSRNRAIVSSRAEVLAFIDDDVVPSPTWVNAVKRLFEEDRGVAGAFGPVEPVFLGGKHCALIPRSLYWVFSCTPSYAPRSRFPFYRGFSANMAFRREILRVSGGLRMDLGVGSSSEELLGEDAELALRLCAKGYRVVFEPRMLVRHVVPGWRCSTGYIARRAYIVGRTNRAIERLYGYRGSQCGGSAALSMGLRAITMDLPGLAAEPRAALLLALGAASFLAGYVKG